MKFKLKKDIVIPVGTVFSNIDGQSRKYLSGNYSTSIGLTKNTCGEIVYDITDEFPEEQNEWFEKVNE